MTDEPTFAIPTRPERRYTAGSVEYEGEVVFSLTPREDRSTATLDDLLSDVLADDRYVRGDFFDLPAPVYLVHDEVVGTSFRAVVRDGEVQLHVLPDTDRRALVVLYGALADEGDVGWSVERRVAAAGEG